MKKTCPLRRICGTIAFLTLLLNSFPTRSQPSELDSLLKCGKVEFDKDYDEQDYDKAVECLEKAKALEPNDPEIRYYLAYAYSRKNSKDGAFIPENRAELTVRSSEELEKVIELEPKYSGEILVLDPYSKISSEWGSLAMKYLYSGRKDSADWALKEGKRRGGFKEFYLALSRKKLDRCSENAILFSSGDNFTYHLLYVQEFEEMREDVTVVDVSLLNTKWYPKHLKRYKELRFGIPSERLDSIKPIKWKDSTLTIKDFEWTLGPTYGDEHILNSHFLMINILRAHLFKKDIYFTKGFPEGEKIGLQKHLNSLAFIDQLTPRDSSGTSFDHFYTHTKDLLKLSEHINKNSTDQLESLDMYRLYILMRIDHYISNDRKEDAKELLELLNEEAASKEFPNQSQKMKRYENYIKRKL